MKDMEHIIDELKATIITIKGSIDYMKLQQKWEVGRIIESHKDIGTTKVVDAIKKHTGISTREVYRGLAFYREYPGQDFDKVHKELPAQEGREPQWNHILKTILEGGESFEDCKHTRTITICVDCRKKQ